MDWNGNLLALAHDSGCSILTPIPAASPIARNLPSGLQTQWTFQCSLVKASSSVVHVRFTSQFLVMAHEDRSLTVVNHLGSSKEKHYPVHHTDDINGIDVSEDGLVVSCGDDRQVIVWDHEGQHSVTHLDNIPTMVKFWMDQDCDKLIIVENGTTLKVMDWRKQQRLYTIYPTTFAQGATPVIKDVIVQGGELVVVGDGWWKRYNPAELQGGAGFTFANSEGQLSGWSVGSTYIQSSTKPLIGGVGSDRSSFYDLCDRTGKSHQFKMLLPSVAVTAGSINHQRVVACASGAKLVLLKPFEVYEAVQY